MQFYLPLFLDRIHSLVYYWSRRLRDTMTNVTTPRGTIDLITGIPGKFMKALDEKGVTLFRMSNLVDGTCDVWDLRTGYRDVVSEEVASEWFNLTAVSSSLETL